MIDGTTGRVTHTLSPRFTDDMTRVIASAIAARPGTTEVYVCDVSGTVIVVDRATGDTIGTIAAGRATGKTDPVTHTLF